MAFTGSNLAHKHVCGFVQKIKFFPSENRKNFPEYTGFVWWKIELSNIEFETIVDRTRIRVLFVQANVFVYGKNLIIVHRVFIYL